MPRVNESTFYGFIEGQQVETTPDYSKMVHERNLSRRNRGVTGSNDLEYLSGTVKVIFNYPEFSSSVISFETQQTERIVSLEEVWLKEYDGVKKDYRNGELVTSTSVEDILNHNRGDENA